MTKEELYAHPGWQWCTFEGAELHTLLMGLQTTFREKIEWLEDAENLTLQLRASREKEKAEKNAPEGPAPARPVMRKDDPPV